MDPIKTDKEYHEALDRIDDLWDTSDATEAQELKTLMDLVKDYEDAHYPIENPDPEEARKIRADDLGFLPEQVLYHDGQTGSVEYSIEDGCWHGKLLGITDLVTYESEEKEHLGMAFIAAVDEYLEFKKEIDI